MIPNEPINGVHLDCYSEISICIDSDIWMFPPKKFKKELDKLRPLVGFMHDIEFLLNCRDHRIKDLHMYEDHRKELESVLLRLDKNPFAKEEDLYFTDGWLEELHRLDVISFKKRNPSSSLREKIIARDYGKCRYCGITATVIHIDHVEPFSRGGYTVISNLVVSCATCNRKKHNKTPDEAGMTLLDESFSEIEQVPE